MEMILQEVDRAVRAQLFYLAVAMALTLPDICSALGSPNGETEGRKYRNWYNANLAARYPNITADDMWSLRNGVLHQGRCGHPNMQYSRILFTLPEPQGNRVHNCIVNDALNLDAIQFCRDVVDSVRVWFAANQNGKNVVVNLPNLVQYRPK